VNPDSPTGSSTIPQELLTSSYDYTLPEDLIALRPASPPDSAKLLVYDRKSDSIVHTSFSEFIDYIPENCAIFLNDTRVVKARMFGFKESGGRVEILLNRPLPDDRYSVMIRGRVREGSLILLDGGVTATVLSLREDGSRVVSFTKEGKSLTFDRLVEVLESIGHVPLPPYIRRDDDESDDMDYQTLFARKAGAVAAPTASLHFTPEILDRLHREYPVRTLTLHVGAGTFKPVESEEILEHQMHSEYFEIPDDAVELLDSDIDILAVGTTVTRSIEYYARTGKRGGECDIFIHPANEPVRVSHLLTNFHLPKSTLLMLVSAFVGREKAMEIYAEAIEKRYRFYSYGDAMLII
jgi:S-adenosylmethionine:tRNA ribosyltransferase-isomerase